MATKICNTCFQEKELKRFPSPEKEYRVNKCSACYWSEKTPEQKLLISERAKRWRENNKSKISEYNRKYGEEYRERNRKIRPPAPPVIAGYKGCVSCIEIKPVSEFIHCKGSYSLKCKVCTTGALKDKVGFKKCNGCQLDKSFDEFSVSKQSFLSKCKTCLNEERKLLYHTNEETRRKRIESGKKWGLKNNDKKIGYTKNWRRKDAGKLWQQKYKPKHKENNLKYHRIHKERLKPKIAAQNKKMRDKLTDGYVRTCLHMKDAPQELVEAKRIELKIKRLIRGKI